jgi:protein tyrosine phosphatase (PTP) superfamily phosphohydrolase (DUF442 family)
MKVSKTEKRIILISSLFLVLFGYGVYNLFQPDRFPINFIRGEAAQVSENLILGPYPSAQELLKLRRMGVSVIVNLMSPDFPVEAPLIKEEDRLCRKYQLECIGFPLSFMNLDSDANRRQVDSVVEYIQSTPGKKYVHCYLGRHRTALVKQRLKQIQQPPSRQAHVS